MSATIAPPSSPNMAGLTGLAQALVNAGHLAQNAAAELARQAQALRTSFASQLITSGTMSAGDLAHETAKIFGTPLLDLDEIEAQNLPKGLLEYKLCAECRVLPLYKRGNRLIIATADPTDKSVAEKIKFSTQNAIDWIVVELHKLDRALDYLGKTSTQSLEGLNQGADFEFGSLDADAVEIDERNTPNADVEDAPVVKFLQKMLVDAYRLHASDLHFEPYENNYRVRFRIDGELREMAAPPPAIKEKLASRIKVISRLDISEKRVPQDGRMKMKIAERPIDFRVSTLPTLFGEKIVIRILDSSAAKIGIDALGYEPEEKKRLLDAIQRPYGMVLVTGPTGSGKTVSLYSCLNLLNQPGVNISTAEDPSEINMPGVNQVNVNEKAGLTFAAALRSFLRQDPDIIMVGEIRDFETADIAMKASQTGHLVLSTLHTNDAPTTLTRLRNMGVAPFNIASSVTLITAQRLARRLCKHCRQPTDIAKEVLLEAGFQPSDLDGSWQPYKSVGCSQCNRGYKGRVGIYQVMPISEAIQAIILRDGNAQEIGAQARAEGVRTLRESGLLKVRQGVTTLEEVLAVTNL